MLPNPQGGSCLGLPLPKPPSVPLHRGQKTARSWSRPSPAVSTGGLDHWRVPQWGPQSHQIPPMPCLAVGQRLGWSQTCTLLKVHRYETLSRVIAWGAGVGEDRVSPQMLAAPSHWEAPTEAFLLGVGSEGPQEPGVGTGGQGGQPVEARVQQQRRRPQTPETGRGRGSGGREGGLARSSRPPYCTELLAASLPGSQLQGGSRARALLCPNHTASRVVSVVKTNVSQRFVSTAGGARGPQ